MSNSATTLADVLANFKASGVPNDVYQAVANAIDSSQPLQNALNSVIADQILSSFTYVPGSGQEAFNGPTSSSGGTMVIGGEFINGIYQNPALLTDFLAHETQHAVDDDPNSTLPGAGEISTATNNFVNGLNLAFSSSDDQAAVDLTNLFLTQTNAQLQNEGLAAIAGYNAVAATMPDSTAVARVVRTEIFLG